EDASSGEGRQLLPVALVLAQFLLQGERQHEGEGRAPPRFAMEADFAAHEFDQALGDGEAEAGAAELARGRGVRLGEWRKQARLLGFRNADTGVAHFEAQGGWLLILAEGLDAEDDFAAVGELDRND